MIPAAVTLQTNHQFTLSNDLIRLVISQKGRLIGLSYRDSPNLISSGYWNFNGQGYDAEENFVSQEFAVLEGHAEVVRCSDDLAEVAFVHQPEKPMFFQASLHYMLRRGDPGFYLYMTVAHSAEMPAGYITQYAYNLRLNPEQFDYIAVDDARRHISHTCQDEANAAIIMDATCRLPNKQIVSKYNYTHAIEDEAFNLYGWAGSNHGLWWIQASGEYYGSTPFRVLLTCHQTATTPVILWQTHCTHRGGYEIGFPPNDATCWEKIYGPAFVYCNAGKDYDALWKDAKDRVAIEQTHWPYQWMSHRLFPVSRGAVSGILYFDNRAPVAGAWIILSPERIHWSRENKGYHFWTKTDAHGHFTLEQIRPGRYTLFAVGADQFYEFQQDGIVVTANQATELGTLQWSRVRHGRRIWQIGIADRSTGEFANGNDFHHWGLWRRYPIDFPEDVTFKIGKSKEETDWNFAHWNWYSQKNAWTIEFELNEEPIGIAWLTFGIAAATGHDIDGFRSNLEDADLRVMANDQLIGNLIIASTGSESFRSARQSTRYTVKEISFDAGLLRQGKNTIVLSHALSNLYKSGEAKGESGSGPGCIMYDAIRLEIESPGQAQQRN